MSTAAAIVQGIGPYQWNAQVYRVLTLASQLAATVKNKSNTLLLAWGLHKINRSLDAMFETVHAGLEGRIPSAPNAEPVTPERLHAAADNIIQLQQTLDYIFDAGKRARLLNNSTISGVLLKIGSRREELLDLADWFESGAQADEVDALFERSRQERERGEVFNIDQAG